MRAESKDEVFGLKRSTTVGDLKKFLEDIPDNSRIYIDAVPTKHEERQPSRRWNEIKFFGSLMRADWSKPNGVTDKGIGTLILFNYILDSEGYHVFEGGRKIRPDGNPGRQKAFFRGF